MEIKTRRLPAEYQEVEWIGEPTGKCSIQTNYTPAIGDTFEFKLYHTSQGGTVFSAGTGTYQCCFLNGYYKYFSSGNTTQPLPLWHTYDCRIAADGTLTATNEAGVVTVSTQEVAKTKGEVNTAMRLFMRADGTIPAVSITKLYYFRNAHINLIPCYRISDDEIGMYDTVGGVFYTNSGTGTFSKGADVVTTESIVIPEGTVTRITDGSGNVIWQKYGA